MNHDGYKELLSALLDGELAEAERGDALAHLDGCADCRAYFAELSALRGALADPEPVEVPAGFADGVLLRLRAEAAAEPSEPARAEAARARRSGRNRKFLVSLAAAAAVLAVVLLPRTLRMGGAAGSQSASIQSAPAAAAPSAAADEAAAETPAEAEARVFAAPAAPPVPAGGAVESAQAPASAKSVNEDAGAQLSAVPDDYVPELPKGADGSLANAASSASMTAAEVTEPPLPSASAAEEALTGGAEAPVLTLYGEGAEEWLAANCLDAPAGDSLYVVSAAALAELPEGLTLTGIARPDADGLVTVRAAETEAAP